MSEWYHGATMTPLKGIRFRMTPQQHAELVADAERNGRSLQKEISDRVFGFGRSNPERVPRRELAAGDKPGTKSGGRSEEAASIPGDELAGHAPPAPAASSPKRTRTKVCEHRVPVGVFCKRCD